LLAPDKALVMRRLSRGQSRVSVPAVATVRLWRGLALSANNDLGLLVPLGALAALVTTTVLLYRLVV
jgi:hypothetical protein